MKTRKRRRRNVSGVAQLPNHVSANRRSWNSPNWNKHQHHNHNGVSTVDALSRTLTNISSHMIEVSSNEALQLLQKLNDDDENANEQLITDIDFKVVKCPCGKSVTRQASTWIGIDYSASCKGLLWNPVCSSSCYQKYGKCGNCKQTLGLRENNKLVCLDLCKQ